MRQVLAFAFIAMIVSSTMLPEVKLSASQTFAKLKKTNAGKNILNAIQIELSSTSQENIVNNVLALLQELLNDQSAQKVQAESDLAAKHEYCDSTRVSYEGQISSKEGDVAIAQARVPVLQQELDADVYAKSSEEARKSGAESSLEDAHRVNDAATEAFEKSTRNHNAMIDALRAARELIAQLQASSFLQKNDNILIQLKAHKQSALVQLQNHKASKLFSILMQMAEDVGIQADQPLVGSVLEIIDDLINHETDSVNAEALAEAERVAEYTALVNSLEATIASATAEIARLESEILRVQSEIDTNNSNIEAWSIQLAELRDLLASHNGQCDSDIQAYEELIVELTEQIDVIQQVIDIFNGQAIQDVKDLVESL